MSDFIATWWIVDDILTLIMLLGIAWLVLKDPKTTEPFTDEEKDAQERYGI